jgi:RNA polymerase sigma-70 factor, ECF subfamily
VLAWRERHQTRVRDGRVQVARAEAEMMTRAAVLSPVPTLGHVAATDTDNKPDTDYELAQAAAGGDRSAFELLYARHSRRVYSLCLRMTQNPAEAEDLSQEVFIQLFRKIGSFRGDAQFTTWLHRLTVNQVLMHFRRKGVRLEQTTDDGETPVQVVEGTQDPRRMPVVERIALEKAVGQLPPGYRSVFVLHDVEGHEHEEIARMLGCSVGTSKSQLHKARMKLRTLLKQKRPPRSRRALRG